MQASVDTDLRALQDKNPDKEAENIFDSHNMPDESNAFFDEDCKSPGLLEDGNRSKIL